MLYLVLGLVLFAGGHLFPVWLPETKSALVKKSGTVVYKASYVLLALLSFWLVLQGWQKADTVFLYDLGPGARHLQLLLMPLAFILFVSSFLKSWTGTLIRHQQLTAVKLWAVGHILANGDSKSLVLFGGFLIWAVLMVIGLKKRDGAWRKPHQFSIPMTILGIVLGLLVFYAVASHHALLYGVSVLPDWAH